MDNTQLNQSIALSRAAPSASPLIPSTPELRMPGNQVESATPINPITAALDKYASLVTGGNAAPQPVPTLATVLGGMIPQADPNASSLGSTLPPGAQIHETALTSQTLPKTLSVQDADVITQQTGGYDKTFDPNNPGSVLTPTQAQQLMNNKALQRPSLESFFGSSTDAPPAAVGSVKTPSDPNKAANKALLEKATASAFGADQVPYMNQVINRESGFNASAQNPTSTASGMFQFLNSTGPSYGIKGPAKNAPVDQQIQAGVAYVKAHYGTPQKAWEHEQQYGWY